MLAIGAGGDGVGPDIASATKKVVKAAVAKAYGSRRKIVWMKMYAGEEFSGENAIEWPTDLSRDPSSPSHRPRL